MEGLSIVQPVAAIANAVVVAIVNIVMFWVFAAADWPTLGGSGRQ